MLKTVSLFVLLFALCVSAQVATTQPTLLSAVSGEWVIVSSSGEKGRGHVFINMVRTPMTIAGNRISWIEASGTDSKGKTIWVRFSRQLVPRPDVSPRAVDIEQVDAYKGWSRIAIMDVVGDELHLCMNFTQLRRPSTFAPDADGREYVVLRRVRIAGEPGWQASN